MEQLPYYGYLLGEHLTIGIVSTVVLVLLFSYLGLPLIVWTLALFAALVGFGAPMWLVATYIVVMAILNVKPLRRVILSGPILGLMKGMLPKISQTERTALEAGVVWAEADLFSGSPDFNKLMNEPYPELTAEEKAFIDGPVNELCELIDDWKVWKEREVPEPVWNFIKEKGFLGMIIPKEHGGLGFSALAHSEVIMKVSTRSIAASISIMVPNSLGPAELLTHYGTEEQKKRYLKRLADGVDLPCFGLTEPQAGSDAGSIVSDAVLFKGDDGKIYMRLNWRKRWITLAAISTVIGLAFRLRDPENLLGRGEDLGITCALIPSDTKGVEIGLRHDPLGVPFYNCPTEGHDVEVNAEDCIIGGLERAGDGWGMLMESLGAGRGISLPAQSTGGLKLATLVTTAHSTIRKQFGLSIGKFEGVEEPLSRIVGTNYLLEAMRKYTLGALDQGIKPPVVTAMAKYNATEMGRQSINDAMDIVGGAGITMGPRNLLAVPYIATPIGITVEGANILTRTLMVFGQGALRAHPYAFKEVNAAENGDVKAFDEAFWGHMGHVSHNKSRSFVLSLTRGWIAGRGYGHGVGRYFQKLSWVSASFAIMADIAMATLGGQLKFKEKITGRFADILSWMYIGTAVLRKYKADGYRKEDLPFVHYSMQLALFNIQKSFDGIFANYDVPVIGWFFRGPIRWWSRLNSLSNYPSDQLQQDICRLMMEDSEQRQRFTEGVFVPQSKEDQLGRLENAFKHIKAAEAVEKKIKKAIRTKALPKKRVAALIDEALEKGIITAEEKAVISKAEELRWDAIQVDDFTQADYLSGGTNSYTKK